MPIIHMLPTMGPNYVAPPKKEKDKEGEDVDLASSGTGNPTSNQSSFRVKAKTTGMTFDDAKPQVKEDVCFECPIY